MLGSEVFKQALAKLHVPLIVVDGEADFSTGQPLLLFSFGG